MLDNSAARRASSLTMSRRDDGALSLVVNVLEAGLEADDVLLDLLDEGEVVGGFLEARIGLDLVRLGEGGTRRDQEGVDAVVLGPLEFHMGEGLDLERLQHEHLDAAFAQVPDDALLVTAGGLDADPADPGLGETGGKLFEAGGRVVDLPAGVGAKDSDVEFGFGCIDPCNYDSVCHLRRPCLVKRA